MATYALWVQPDTTTQFVVTSPRASDADAFARWLHVTTGAAISIYDERRMSVRKQWGNFNHNRT